MKTALVVTAVGLLAVMAWIALTMFVSAILNIANTVLPLFGR